MKLKIITAIKEKNADEISKIAESITSKSIRLTSTSKIAKVSSELNNKIEKWLENTNIDQIQTEFLTFFNENISEQNVTKNIDKYKEIVKEKEKKTMVLKLQELFNNVFGEELEEEFYKNKNEINNLLKEQKYEQLKERLFGLIDQISILEKSLKY
ncbi:hypothetical protein [Mycoplasma capricolum]|uniref:hypothetical protein n=1 Tax=Mycoplasma capricolum TaxID=2095 RepID=UPI001E501997|nr:hypothetical protein [Mycoplasma capricolum]